MKYHIGFFAILLLVFASFGYLALTFNEQDLFLFHGSNVDMGQFLNTFQQKHKPVVEINFTALYGESGQFQVLHPLLDMRKLKLEVGGASCPAIGQAPERHVQSRSTDPFASETQPKRDALDRFLLQGIPLSDRFITTPPFVDSSGSSFAYLLSQKGPEPFSGRIWVQLHLSFFKTSELREILNKYGISDPEYGAIARLSEGEMEEVIRGTSPVLTKDFLLFRNQSRLGFSPLSYTVYEVQDLHTDLKLSKYDLIAAGADTLCLQKMGNVCWTYNSRHALAYLYRYSLALLILIGSSFFIFLCLYFKHLYLKTKEQQKHRLALQVLSHEFRTPTTAMLLIIDQLTKNQPQFSVADQDLLTRMSTEVFRLQRIIEISKTYLQAESHRIHFNPIEIPSLNEWLLDFIQDSNLKIEHQLLHNDQALRVDPFWLKFIISNLVQNAFAHGQAPVRIRLAQDSSKLRITVEDQGQCEFQSLQQMTGAFVKSSHSKGMGLGLNIAQFIAQEWGSQIEFCNSPTSFTLSMGGIHG